MAKKKYINYFKNKNILITGGTGLIGMPLAQMLIDLGAKISIVSLDKKPKLKGKFKFLKKDLRLHFAVRLLTKISRQGSEHSIKKNLLKELQETSSVNSKSLASNKCLLAKKQLYQLAQINKSFTHYRWF